MTEECMFSRGLLVKPRVAYVLTPWLEDLVVDEGNSSLWGAIMTRGTAHSEQLMELATRADSKRSSSLLTWSTTAYGTDRLGWKRGFAFCSRYNFAFAVADDLGLLENTVLHSTSSGTRMHTETTIFQQKNIVTALTTTGDLLVYRVCGFDTNTCLEPHEVDQYLPLRIRLPSPYRLSCRSNTVGLLPNCLYSRQNSELANQLQLTKFCPEENSNDLIHLWIRGIVQNRTENGTQQQNERLFCVQIQ
ncbi:hypothetical protein EG68_08512 [Paragonimus skrjabini miyazakii]|uniref:Uncharacterized protein n=1 Tax=Paragonimus skrjabini miyazakii TaxID=59628 RepID=A0A8S9YN70_9TREM|nr:hypothetical protein EG68_08512 [Paragonimus skrjabini miyazakii]